MARVHVGRGAMSAVVLCGTLVAATAWAEQLPDEPAPVPEAVPAATVPILKAERGFEEQGIPATEFDSLWNERQTALQRGDPVQERAILNEMVSKRAVSGWPNLFTYAIVLARQSLDAAASQDYGLAQLRSQAAVGLAPDHPLTHAAYAQVAWSSGLPKMLVLEEYARALWLCVSEPVHARRIGGEVLVAAWFSILVASLLFAFITLFRHMGTVVEDIERLLPYGSTRQQRWLLVIAIALTPLLLGLGSVVSIVIWLSITGFHMARSERLASVTVLVWLTLLPLALPIVLSHLSYPGSPSEHLYLAGRDQTAPERALDIHSLAAADPAHAKLIRGSRAYWAGHLDEAHGLLEEAAKHELAGPEIYTALGNSRFRLGKRTGAIEAYLTAEELDPDHVTAVYNASRVYYSLADHAHAVSAHQRAAALDFNKVTAYEADAEHSGNWFVADEVIPNHILFAKAWREQAPSTIADAFWQTFFIYERRESALTALTGLILALLIAILRHGLDRTEPTPGQKRYHARLRRTFSGDPAEDRSIQIRRQIAVHRRQARLLRLQRGMGVIVAGGAHMVKGASLTGLILACLFGTSLILFLGSVGMVPALVPLEVKVSRLLAIPYGGLVFLWYSISLVIKPREDW